MKQQAGIGILLALTTAMCWGALPIAMKQVLEVMEPPTVVFYRFLMASIGLGAILAVKGKLPPLRLFRKPRWLVLLAIATGGLGMMVASVFILKEKMRGTQIIGASMLLCGLGELWRRAKGVIASACLTADPLFAVHFVYNSIAAISEAGRNFPA